MLATIGPMISTFIAPGLLILVMLFPVPKPAWPAEKAESGNLAWTTATTAGWAHSIGWTTWLFALAKS